MNAVKVKNPITNEIFEMTLDQIEAAYRYQEKEYRKMDVVRMLEERLEWLGDNKDEFKKEYGVSYYEAVNDADYLVECFFDKFDCNIPENEIWTEVFDEYFGHTEKEN